MDVNDTSSEQSFNQSKYNSDASDNVNTNNAVLKVDEMRDNVVEVEKKASDIVDEVIDSASLCLLGSTDLSINNALLEDMQTNGIKDANDHQDESLEDENSIEVLSNHDELDFSDDPSKSVQFQTHDKEELPVIKTVNFQEPTEETNDYSLNSNSWVKLDENDHQNEIESFIGDTASTKLDSVGSDLPISNGDFHDVSEKDQNHSLDNFVEDLTEDFQKDFENKPDKPLENNSDFSTEKQALSNVEAAQDASEIKEKESDGKIPEEEEWMDVLGNGLLRKKIVTKGQGHDSKPQRGQEVTINLVTRLSDGTVAEESHQVVLILGDHEVPEALDMTVNLMELGEKSEIISDAKYCYGAEGKPPHIPPGENLSFIVELENIEEGPYNTSVPVRKRLDWVDRKRATGNQLYLKKKFFEASGAYLKCTRVLQQAANQDQPEEIKAEIEMFSLKCHNNLAATRMMQEQWKEALQACQVAEKIDPKNLKTLMRKAKILSQLGELNRGISTLKTAADIDPDDLSIQAELSKLNKKQSDQKASQKKMYERMFGCKSPTPKPEPKSSTWSNFGLLITGSVLAVGGAVLLGVFMAHR